MFVRVLADRENGKNRIFLMEFSFLLSHCFSSSVTFVVLLLLCYHYFVLLRFMM